VSKRLYLFFALERLKTVSSEIADLCEMYVTISCISVAAQRIKGAIIFFLTVNLTTKP